MSPIIHLTISAEKGIRVTFSEFLLTFIFNDLNILNKEESRRQEQQIRQIYLEEYSRFRLHKIPLIVSILYVRLRVILSTIGYPS